MFGMLKEFLCDRRVSVSGYGTNGVKIEYAATGCLVS
jgi:hypothetical protein